MEIIPTTDKLLMSDALKGRLPAELEDEALAAMEKAGLTVVIMVQVGTAKQTAIVGLLRSVLSDDEPELEFRTELHEALNVVAAWRDYRVVSYELHHGERVVEFNSGPFDIKGARLDELDLLHQMCTLSLGLKRHAATVL